MQTSLSPQSTEPDPYIWLEDPRDERAIQWAAARSGAAQSALQSMTEYEQILQKLKKLNGVSDPVPDYHFLPGHLLRVSRNEQSPHGVLSVAPVGSGRLGGWVDVLNMETLRREESTPWELRLGATTLTSAPGSGHVLLPLSPDGGDTTVLREFNPLSGTFIADGFRLPAGRNNAVWLTSDVVLVQHTVDGAPVLPTGWPKEVHLWRRGTQLADANVVFSAEDDDALILLGAVDDGEGTAGIVECWRNYSTVDTFLISSDSDVVRSAELPRRRKMILPAPVAGPFLIGVATEEGTCGGISFGAESVLAYDTRASSTAKSRLHVVFVPEHDEYLADTNSGIASNTSSVSMVFSKYSRDRVHTSHWDGTTWHVTRGDEQEPGTSTGFKASDTRGEARVIETAGFTQPAMVVLQGAGAEDENLYSESPVIDLSNLHVQQRRASSPDGTEVDYYLIGPTEVEGPTPTLFTGYGAFGITVRPSYFGWEVGGSSLALWFDRGGSLAIPAVRGGGEKGTVWHRAAMREGRQRSYDDFAAAIEDLQHSGYTTPDHTGVFGMSNGGLLAAVIGTQRPDLVGAVVSDVPLTDMIRLRHMGMGAAWLEEYGDADDPTMNAVLSGYSPYQAIQDGGDYPPFLVTVATSDDRVGPGHARKLAARLEEAGATVLFLEDQHGGHGVSDALTNPELMAARMTFLVAELM
ncbi:prolyl oligopeptidase family serine peptidase [Paenarthrobacter sp. NPDC091669]|uniref:prolyl oligopeptidase family serine peptidase n=1 Tax=Paenarthrobacter sp. NPDC091669 TaxID=3364384 RepID=UPI0037F394E8